MLSVYPGSRVVATLSTATVTWHSMKVDHHVLIVSGMWTVTCFVKLDVFPPQSLGRFWHSRHSLLENCQISDECCDLLSFVLVEGVVYSKRWRHQTAKQRHQTEPG